MNLRRPFLLAFAASLSGHVARLAALALMATLVAALSAAPAANAQTTRKMPRIGVLVSGVQPAEHVCVKALRQGLADLGYVEGRTYVFDFRWAEGRPEQEAIPVLGAELVKGGADIVVSVASAGLMQSKAALASVPVVVATGYFPVELGLVTSLARPGGNITGMALFTSDLFAKRVQLLAEAVPNLKRIAVLAQQPNAEPAVRAFEEAARRLGLTLQVIKVAQEADFVVAFKAAERGNAQAVMTTQSTFFYQYRQLFADLALQHRLPSISGEPGAAEAGVLMTHGASIADSCHRTANFVHRILQGAKPADLPMEMPLRYPMVINLKTARALGLAIPQSLLLRADEVIE